MYSDYEQIYENILMIKLQDLLEQKFKECPILKMLTSIQRTEEDFGKSQLWTISIETHNYTHYWENILTKPNTT